MPNDAAPVTATPEITQAPQTTEQSAAPAKSGGPLTAEELIELKVNGQSRKYTLDQLKARATLADGAHERFEKASQIEKREAQLREGLKTDFLKTLMDPELGLTRDQIKSRFEKWYKNEFIDPETMSPEQRELEQLKREKAERDARDKEAEEEKKTQAEKDNEARERVNFQKQIIETLEKHDLPKTRFTVGRIAYWQKLNLDKGYDAPAEVIVQQVKDEEQAILKNAVKSRMENPAKLVAYLGEDIVKAIRKYDLERLKEKFGGSPSHGGNPTDGAHGSSGQKHIPMSKVDDYFNELRRSKR